MIKKTHNKNKNCHSLRSFGRAKSARPFGGRYEYFSMKLFLFLATLILSGCGDISKSLDEGYKYGEKHTLGQCFEESLVKLNACEDSSCVKANIGFPRGCAATASVDPKFCSTVPNSLMEAASAMKTQCSGHKFEKACYKYMQQPVVRCLDEKNS